MYFLYSALIATPLFIINTALVTLSVALASLFHSTRMAHYYIPRYWGISSCRLYLLPVRVEGLEHLSPDQSYIFLANHQGYFDILLMYGYLNRCFKWIMKEYLKKMPLIGFACMSSGQIFVGESLSSIQKAIAHARQTLRGGLSMSIFPEGTRTHDGKLQPFKRGAFMLANEVGLPLVPITINGSFRAFSRKAWHVTRTPLTLTVHAPLTLEDRQGKTTKQVMQEVYDIINADIKE